MLPESSFAEAHGCTCAVGRVVLRRRLFAQSKSEVMVRGSATAQLSASPLDAAGEGYVLVSWSMSPPANWDALTRAELAVATALIEGASNREIAAARGSSVRTVANQVASIFRKLGVRSRGELVTTGARAV